MAGSAAGGVSGTAGPGGSGGATQATKSILEIASGDARFSTLVAAVQKAGLTDALKANGLTVFAPTNDAFGALLATLGKKSLDDLTAQQLKPILIYHVLGTKVDAAAANAIGSQNGTAQALGGVIHLSVDAGKLKLDKTATVIVPDVMATNGVIHAIDAVILPTISDIVAGDPTDFSNLGAAVTTAGLAATLADDTKQYTVFAPVNAAFDALVTGLKGNPNTGVTAIGDFTKEQLTPILLYHVATGSVPAATVLTLNGKKTSTLGGTVAVNVSGTTVSLDKAKVLITDIIARNGVIHVIDSVLLPSITDVVTTAPNLTQLKGALVAADADPSTPMLVPTFDDDTKTLSLFAPNDDAFGAVLTGNSITGGLPGLVTAIGGGSKLISLLQYHAAGSTLFAKQVIAADGTSVPVLSGGTVKINLVNGKVVLNSGVASTLKGVNSSEVLTTNLFASNGVIHVIKSVISAN